MANFTTTRKALKDLLAPLEDGTSTSLAHQIRVWCDNNPDPATDPATPPSDDDAIIIHHKQPQ